jgi:hypothetical protein
VNDDQRAAAEQRADLQRADAFERLLELPGWKLLLAEHEAWAERYAKAAKHVDTNNTAGAVDALRQWQLAEEFLRLQAEFINSTLRRAHDIRQNMTLADAELMEQVHHEQQSPERRTADSAGY